MKSMSLTDFRKDIYNSTKALKKGEKMYLTLNGEVVLKLIKQVDSK
jgi:hypothetical protein